jgi:hypothetical protein
MPRFTAREAVASVVIASNGVGDLSGAGLDAAAVRGHEEDAGRDPGRETISYAPCGSPEVRSLKLWYLSIIL